MKRLYVKDDSETEYQELAAIAVGQSITHIHKTEIQEAINKYLDLCTAHKSPKNQASEKLYFRILKDFLTEFKVKSTDQITAAHMDGFESMLIKKMKPSSVNRRFKTIKHFFRKCLEWNFIYQDPLMRRKQLKEEYNPRKAWTKEIFTKFIATCSGLEKDIFTFMWLTGCRQSELHNLKWNDINYDEKTLILRCGKNSQVTRPFPITPEIGNMLHSLDAGSIHVFSRGNTQPSTDNLYQYAKHRLVRLGLKELTPYGMRHGFGTRLAEMGVSAFYIAELMGHSNIDTTRKYVHSEKKMLIVYVSNAS